MLSEEDNRSDSYGLQLWAKPLPEEPAHGLLFRLASVNGYPTTHWIRQQTGLSIYQLRRGAQFERLAQATRSDVSDIAHDSFTTSEQFTFIRGQKLGCHIFSSTRRVCPLCLAESEHHRFAWDLRFFTCCPKHGIKLVDRCSCARAHRLNWKDGRLYRGGCCKTGDVRTLAPAPADPDILLMEKYFAGRLGIRPTVSVPLLDALELSDAESTIERIGSLDLAGYQKSWSEVKRLKLDTAETCARGFKILIENRFSEVLDRTYSQYKQVSPGANDNLLDCYGWFYPWLGYKGLARFSMYLVAQVKEHAAGKFRLGRSAVNNLSPRLPDQVRSKITEHHRNYYTLAQGAKACGLHPQTFLRLVRSLGLVDHERRSSLGRHIPRSQIEALMILLPRLINKTDAALLCGMVSGAFIDQLIREGLIVPFLDCRPPFPKISRVLRDDVEDLFERLKARCRPGLPNGKVKGIGDVGIRMPAHKMVAALIEGFITEAWYDPSKSGLKSLLVSANDLEKLRRHINNEDRLNTVAKPKRAAVPSFEYWVERARNLETRKDNSQRIEDRPRPLAANFNDLSATALSSRGRTSVLSEKAKPPIAPARLNASVPCRNRP
jgi:hypothetical protein